MKKPEFRKAALPAFLAVAFILLDLLLDRWFGGFGRLDWAHLTLAVAILLTSYFLMNRAVDAARHAEAVLQTSRDELESRVAERTAELEQANAALQAEIFERKRIEQALQTSEETARALLNASSESAVLLDPQGIILAANGSLTRGLGVTVERLVSSCLFDFFPPQVSDRRRLVLDQILTTAQPVHFVDERAGRTFDNHVYPVSDADGKIIKIAAFGQDITERLQAEARLRETIDRLEFTQAAAGAGSWDWAIPSGHLKWSAKMFELFGLDPQTTAASFDAWRSVLHPEDRETAEKKTMVALEEHSDLENEYRIVLPGGEFRWISALGRGAYDDRGQPVRMSGICLDITDRKRGEVRIQRLSSFPQLNPNPVLEVGASGTISFYNPAATRTLERLGLAENVQVFLPGDMATILQELDQQRESEHQREVQVGAATFVETIHVIPTVGVARIYGFEITESVRAQRALAASELKYRLLFQNMAEGFALYELVDDEQGRPVDWRVVEVNNAYQLHTGIARDQIVGRRMSELFPASIPEYLPRFAQVVDTQIPCEFETYAAVVGRHQRVSTFPAGGRRFASTIEDITKRKESEGALRQTQAELALDIQKRSALEERQRLARELHDSVSQALYGVSLGVHTALSQLDTDRAKVREALDFALSLTHAGLMEMRALIFELRPESLENEGLVVAITKQVDRLRARHGIEVELSLCSEPDTPFPIKEALYRIAQEALQNAIKHAQSSRLDVSLTCVPGGLTLEVCDGGVGFDPTMEYPGHLGLRSMRERVQGLGGTLEIVSAKDCGTQVRCFIPVPEMAQPGS